MEFLVECARRLDDGEEGSDVLQSLKQRYTTIRCVSSKASLVRRLCRPTDAFRAHVEASVSDPAVRESLLQGTTRPPKGFPHRLPLTTASFRLDRREARDCKREAGRAAMQKNRLAVRVDGRKVLETARAAVDELSDGRRDVDAEVVLSFLVLTGRRTCEVLNGKSTFLACEHPHCLWFTGQVKKRTKVVAIDGATEKDKDKDEESDAPHVQDRQIRAKTADDGVGGEEPMLIPVLHDATRLLRAYERIHEWTESKKTERSPQQDDDDDDNEDHAETRSSSVLTDNQRTSQRFQSWLSRNLHSSEVFGAVRRVHGLRGLYACMCTRLFEWEEDHTQAFLVMNILGHTGLQESLVYTTFLLGKSFAEEPCLGPARLLTPSESSSEAGGCVRSSCSESRSTPGGW